jgi:hypothetical protein
MMFQVHQEQILLIFLDIGLYVDAFFFYGVCFNYGFCFALTN